MAAQDILLLCMLNFHLTFAIYSCAYDEFMIEDASGKAKCMKCPSCPLGTGLSHECGSNIKKSNLENLCQPCQLGSTYSDKYDISPCKQCQICSKHQTVARNCTLTSNSQCNNTCSYGYYYEDLTGDCQKCQEGQYLVADNKGGHCEECKVCPPGTSPYPQCGSVVESTSDMICVKCVPGETFSDKGSPCRGCSKCSLGQEELAPCSLTSDTVCSKCVKGFYKDENSTKCKPCSACCNDGKDVHIVECAEQNMPQSQQCSYTRRAVSVCQQQRNQGPTPQKSKRSAFVSMAIGVAVGLSAFVVAMLYWGLKYRKDKRRSNAESLALLVPFEEGEVAQATLEEPSANGKQETLSFEKSGVILQFNDADSFIQDAQGIRLEICWDKAATITLLPHEVQLSPVIKFHPHGYKLSKPVQVRIPHTALVFQSHGWNIKLKSSSIQSGGFVWQDEEMSETHNNEVSFQTNSLLCYVVVGTAVYNSKPTKKRLQCAVFGGEGKVGENFTAYLYVFDDCEASLEKIMQEERSKTRILLGSIQSLYVESVLDTDIKITIQQPLKGWKVGYIKPQVILHKSLQESFQRIPRSEILFEHDNGRNRDFLCTFELTADNITTEICAVASIKEDPFRRNQESNPTSGQNHQMVTGRNLCDPLITNKDKPSLCFHKLPTEILHAVCMKLDLPLKGVGNWRHVAEKLGFTQQQIENFRGELLTPDGSPCTVMIEALTAKLPEITVAEFVQILQFRKIQRFDVVDILEPYIYDTIPAGNED